MAEEYLTLTEARRYIHVSEYKLQQLVGDNQFPTIPNPYHKGSFLVKKSDLDAWLATAPRRPKPRKSPEEKAGKRAALAFA
jgi:hypothetical protein